MKVPNGYLQYRYKVICNDLEFGQWFEMINWCKANFDAPDRDRWNWGWPDIFFRDEQDLIFFQLRWGDCTEINGNQKIP